MKKWFAVKTVVSCESKVVRSLTKKGLEAYLPTVVSAGKGMAAHKLNQPLIAGLALVKTTEDIKPVLIKTPGLLNFYYWLNKPATVTDVEVELLKDFLDRYRQVQKQCIAINDESLIQIRTSVTANDFPWTVNSEGMGKLFLPSLGYCLTAMADENFLSNYKRVG